MIRLTAPTGKPYDFGMSTAGQCTWYAYHRAIEEFNAAPCWYDGKGDDGYGYYTNAKEWLKHARGKWQVKDANYTPVHGDIVVFDGTYGHVAFVEKLNSDGKYTLSNYNRIKDGKYTLDFWITDSFEKGKAISGCGKVLGYLHYPVDTPTPTPTPTEITTEQAIHKMAQDVISGKYGNGTLRKENIYKAVQTEVNRILR